MKIVREYDIKQIIEFEATDKDKRELVKEILFNQMTSEDSDKLIAEILKDLRATEEEFENRPYLLNAYKTLIESMEYPLVHNIGITAYFTIISIARGYAVRRWFNKKQQKL